MSRKAPFWIVLTLASLLATVFAIRDFPRALPIVSLDLRMDRTAALDSARALAERHHWGPTGFRQAASFAVDDTVKTFVELEGGGTDAFRALLRDGRYHAYTWRVRHFRPSETRETMLRFTPAGQPYAFRVQLREDEPGAALSADSARVIAEAGVSEWGVELPRYTLIERSEQRRPGGRVDHTLVYERPDLRAGEGRYRLRLVVGGDRLTELAPTLRVPEGFARRYENQKSVNGAIATAATITLVLLYVIGGGFIGVLLLWRRRAMLARPAVAWGVGIALLVTLADVNQWPLRWMTYDTALSPGTFTSRAVLLWILGFLAEAGLLSLSFMAAEGLGRWAFPRHPQLWRMASSEAAGTASIAGRTVGGMLLAGLELGYIIGFYLLATRWWGWWVPAESNVDPNVLATYLPWLNAVAVSVHAGFWEEALFRAVPLSCAALLGQRFGHRRLWIGGALVLQALVFGGAHANYASVPAWSRPVELFLPSLMWGAVYLRYGLLPSVLAHFLFDLALLSIPLFTSTAAGAGVDRAVVVLCAVAPLLIVVFTRLRHPQRHELPDALRNGAFVPATAPEPETATMPAPAVAAPMPGTAAAGRALLAAGLIGLIAWATLGVFRADAPPLSLRRDTAIDRARRALMAASTDPDSGWRPLTLIEDAGDDATLFVWQSFGRDTFQRLLGHDLMPPGWTVRFARFEGDIAARAEEWRVSLAPDGAVSAIRHRLPEARPGDSLAVRMARSLALRAVVEALRADPATLREVGAEATSQPARVDWRFTFADTTPPRLPRGERRATVEISGIEVTDAHRFVFVPEDWQRQWRERETRLLVLRVVRGLGVALAIAGGASLAIMAWARGGLAWAGVFAGFGVIFALALAHALNRWPALEAQLSTAQPRDLQVGVLTVTLTIVQLVTAAALTLLLAGARRAPHAAASAGEAARSGVAAGAAAAGVLVIAARLGGAWAPLWPSYDAANSLVPWLAQALTPVWTATVRAAILAGGFAFLNAWRAGGPRRGPAAIALAATIGGLVAHPGGAADLGPWFAQWAVTAAGSGLLYALVLGRTVAPIPVMVATLAVLQSIRSAVRGGHPDVIAGSVAGIVVAIALAAIATRALSDRDSADDTPVA